MAIESSAPLSDDRLGGAALVAEWPRERGRRKLGLLSSANRIEERGGKLK